MNLGSRIHYPRCNTVYLQIHKKSREDAKKKVEMSSYLKEMEKVRNLDSFFDFVDRFCSNSCDKNCSVHVLEII